MHVSVFKAYDIRGIAGEELTPQFAEALGKSIVAHLGAKCIAVARDIRESGPSLHASFIKGVIDSGTDVMDLGVTTTGVLYRASKDLDVDASVMITASHNPPEYNGFKICRGTLPMAGEEIQDLRRTMERGEFRVGQGKILSADEFQNEYIETVVRNAGKPGRRVRIAIDCGNAVPGPLAIEVMERIGVDVVAIHCTWDNEFPNHPPDPTRKENMLDLSSVVVETGCEFGIGMDGDGDRIGVVDENGKFIHPDRLMALFVQDLLSDVGDDSDEERRKIFYDVKCSMALEECIKESGGIPVMVRTGHSFMKKILRENPSSPMAGEMSGHFFLNDRWPGFDDSIYNAARLLEIVGRDPSPNEGGIHFSERFSGLPDYPSTDEVKIPLEGGRDEVMESVNNAFSDMESSSVDGIRVRYPDGWYLCRPSNTEPILVMRAEGRDEEALRSILGDVNSRIGQILDLSKFS
tara:strand:+ start:5055 stop:6446 length:1392 start_codon:yes stop_codon:yes gene_type:complete